MILLFCFSILLIINPINDKILVYSILLIWIISVLTYVFIFKKYIPRYDYYNQIRNGVREIVKQQKNKPFFLDSFQIKDLLLSQNQIVLEKRYKLYNTQSVLKSRDEQTFEPKKMSKLLANYLISPEVMAIKTNNEILNYPLCVQYNINSNHIKNYSSTLNIANKIKAGEGVKLSPQKVDELYTNLNQVKRIYENGLSDVDFIKKRLDEMK